MQPMRLAETDVLVLGAGLAGLRAAWAACDAGRGLPNRPLRVTVAWAGHGPSGSSFANRNDGWGLLAPDDDSSRERFLARTLEIAPPGHIDPDLLAVLAEESADRRHELESLGIHALPRTSRVCFAPNLRAHVFRDARAIFSALAHQVTARDGELLPGVEVLAILSAEGLARGALLKDDAGRLVLFAARAVICALGGPAPLFARNVAGAANPGMAPAILAQAGARLDNLPYLQWMWHDVDTGRFARIDRLAGADLVQENETTPLPDFFAALAADRAAHCPRAFDLATEELDLHLGRHACSGPAAGVVVLPENAGPMRILPHAHASNGGARIDAQGRTSLTGLWACGECATGMHGANRLGGAMVAAALVFGRRAGLDAGNYALQAPEMLHGKELQEGAKGWLNEIQSAIPEDTPAPNPHRAARALFLRDDDEARALLADLPQDNGMPPDADPLSRLIVRLAAARLRKSTPSAS